LLHQSLPHPQTRIQYDPNRNRVRESVTRTNKIIGSLWIIQEETRKTYHFMGAVVIDPSSPQ
jgi:hypothetical protein